MGCQRIYRTNLKGYIMLRIYTDGASRGNPGPAAWAFIMFRNGTMVEKECGQIGRVTNNIAEYTAIINALKKAKKYTTGEVTLYSDSELAINQLNNVYKTRKSHLRELRETVYALRAAFEKVTFFHVEREDPLIQRCDALCNACLDRQ
jgi:ribonuclease HI